ncbi:MAG: glutamine--fructose-6-phosphate transaminase (isomerizing) [Fibrobacterota bacterium]
MCGIVGYIGNKEALPVILTGISRLDYRGYDSVGVTVARNQGFQTFKAVGTVANLRREMGRARACGTLGIGHTRWATHGKPSRRNTHPHLSMDGRFAVVHNGIIENHTALREFLRGKGFVFQSETDTEVIPHLIQHFYQGNLEEALTATLKEVHGTYGLAVLSSNERKLVVACKGSPIILGIIAKGRYLVASDITAITEHTRKVVYLADNDVAVLDDRGYRIFNLENRETPHQVQTIDWSVAAIEKRGYEHFMRKEIHEQPETLSTVLSGRWDAKNLIPKIGGVRIPPLDIRQIDRAIFLACGTSYHAGLVAEYYFEKFAGLRTEAAYASEFLCKVESLTPRDLVLPISQSGETADTLQALRRANEQGAHSLGLVNTVGSTIARDVNGGGMYLRVGPEIGVASTKAYTGQLMTLYLLSLWLGRMRGVLKGSQTQALYAKARALPRMVKAALATEPQIKALAAHFKKSENFIYLGRGINYPTALEGALKLKEISYIHAEGFPAAEMKHGPIALVDKKMPVVVVVKKDEGYERILSNIEEIKARKGIVIAVMDQDDRTVIKKADYILRVPQTTPELSPMVYIVPLQLLAYHVARLRGCEIDKPRNLAKSVTV